MTATAVRAIALSAAVALRVSLVRYQSAAAAAAACGPDQIAVKTSRAAEIVAFSPPVHALIALPANANANVHALVLHVYRYQLLLLYKIML